MPHIIIKSFPGRDDNKKAKLAKKISEAVASIYELPDSSISIDIQEIPREKWMDEVFNKEIEPKMDKLIIKPKYKSV